MKISLSIVIYNPDHKELSSLLSDIRCQTLNIACVVVDNSMADSARDLVESYGFMYIHPRENLGFGAGHNLAFTLVGDSDFHFVVNPDIEIGATVCEELVCKLASSNDTVVVVPNVFYRDGRVQRLCKLLPTPLNLFSRRFFPFLSYFFNRKYELHDFHYDREVELACCSGCFFAIRSDVFKSISGFDQRFFMYLEDFDLARRAAVLGKIIFLPSTRVIHGFRRRSYKFNKLFFVHIRSAILYFNKWGWVVDRERSRINDDTYKKMSLGSRS